MSEGTYDPAFFRGISATSGASAKVVAPLVMSWVNAGSVIDMGCGSGGWLRAFQECGVREICGVDGEYALQGGIVIPRESFIAHDLSKRFSPSRRFDLALCLEVAEHLSPESGAALIDTLAELAPVTLFSAAIPYQPGTHHVHCQWPEYWADLFGAKRFVAIDALRPRTWGNQEVAWWYQQNMILYVREDELPRRSALQALRECSPSKPSPLVHPDLFLQFVQWGIEESKKYGEIYRQLHPQPADTRTELNGER